MLTKRSNIKGSADKAKPANHLIIKIARSTK